MKTNKVLKWLYGVFMFLPMLAIGVTCAYVTFNKNAKDSYSGLNQNTQSNIVIHDLTDFDYSKTYYITNSRATNQVTSSQTTGDIFFNTCNIITNSLNNNLPNDIKRVHWYLPSNNNILYLYVYDSESNMYSYNSNQNILLEVTIDSIAQANYDNLQSVISNSNALYYIDYFNEQQLDNAFYYAVDQFNESGFNKIDFVSFFDMFYENTNIWTTFANTYLNYVLFVSLAFFIPRVLYWFINLAFSLTDSFERKSQGW